MESLTMKKKIKLLEHAFAATAGAYYNINLTKNLVPGSMYQVINNKEYSLNKQMGLSENARFTDVVSYWGKRLDEEEKDAYYDFLAIPNLLERYHNGEEHVSLRYWTKSAIFEPMLAEQHIVMYEDEENGDILGITYVLDLTQQYKEQQYKQELEEKQKRLESALKEAEKVRQYREIQAAVVTVDDILNKLAILDKISTEDELNEIMPELLASLGRYSMSDQACVFTWATEKRQILRMTHEWCADGVAPIIEIMQNLKMKDVPNWASKLNNGEAIISTDWENEKEETPEEHALFKGQGIRSLIVIPIFANKKLNGCIGFANPEQYKAALSIRLLSSIAGHISSLKDNFFMMKEQEKQKIQLEHALKEATFHSEVANSISKKLMEKNRVLSGLSLDYTIAFVLNLDTDDYTITFSQKTNHAKIIKSITKFSDYVSGYVEKFVLPEFKDAMRKTLSSSDIRRRFETEDEYHFSFETIPNAAGLSCFQAHIVKEYEGNEHFAFLGFRSVDEIVKKERFYKEELQKANQALKKQLDMITFALPGGVKISNDDETYSFKYVSEQFANMLGYETPEELMEASGGTIVGLAHPDDVETGIADALEQYSRADHYEITYRMKCKDGSWKYIEDRGHKFYTPKGIVEHWNLILDKNELVEKTIALESEKRANQAKSDFLSRMSHDMRTPLNGIIGLLDICSKHPDDRELVDSSRIKARIAAEHLLALINNVLELSKLENKETPLYEEPFSLPTLLHEVEIIAQMRADDEKITISYSGDIDHFEYPYLIGSPLYIKQILLNIIVNGIKYNQKNGFVYCSVEEKKISKNKVGLYFTIQDTGIGMKQSFLDNIFEPFAQEDEGPRSSYMGIGLGMAIVKNLLDRMDGTIQIESEESIGTTVHIFIPFKIADTDVMEEEIPKRKIIKHTGIQVLLVEDNELNSEIVTFVLEDEGIHVTRAVDGKQAVNLFKGNPENYFDVILMDIMMPNMDGYEATYAIRNSERKDSKIIPIIAMTANAFDDDKEKAKKAEMNDHLAKPLDAQVLIETIEAYCT